MGTNYVVHSDEKHEISVDEHSNKFTLMLSSEGKDTTQRMLNNFNCDDFQGYSTSASFVDSTHYLTETQLVDMAIQMLQVALYWHDDNRAAHQNIKRRVAELVS